MTTKATRAPDGGLVVWCCPMAPPFRALDLVVYGATGFTGEYVVKYLARTLRDGKPQQHSPQQPPLRWGIAGRSPAKLSGLMAELRAKGLPTPNATIIADISDPSSLDAMTRQTRLVLNCTGPYRFLGEPVVLSCLRECCDVMDLCGEPEFMDRCFLKYNDEAAQRKVLVISACAFDSVPADLGVRFAMSVFPPGYTVQAVESFLTIDTGGHGLHGHVTTFEAAVQGFASQRELARIRRDIRRKYPPPPPTTTTTGGPPAAAVLVAKTGPYFEPRIGRYCFRFPASDASVVKSSQRQLVLHHGPALAASLPKYAAYFTVPSVWWAGVVALVGTAFQTLVKSQWGRKLLLRYPGVFTLGAFSAEGPSQEELDAASFAMTFFARGVKTTTAAAGGGGEERGGTVLYQQQEEGTPLLVGGSTGPPPSQPPHRASQQRQQQQQGTTIITKLVKTRVSGPEPGYVATPIIFIELARTLLSNRSVLPVQGGVLTPGAVFYEGQCFTTLIQRLREAGVDFTVLEA